MLSDGATPLPTILRAVQVVSRFPAGPRRHSVFAPLPGGTKLTPLALALTLLRLAKGLLVFLSLAVMFVAVIRVRMQNREN